MSAHGADALIRSRRPPKPFVDPYRAHGSIIEAERRPDGRIEQALTLFATGAECPFTCSFCDLWQYSIEGPTPSGSLPGQVESALASLGTARLDRFKFYNASNFFDGRAVPLEDVPRIAALTRSFAAVTVESHASTIGPRVVDFAERISGRLELAVGLETIHPVAMAHLNKRLDLSRFDTAARFLQENGIELRVFVLLGAPYVAAGESLEWTQRTVKYAMERGAAIVSIIPVRGGNGEMERLEGLGHFARPTLLDLEAALDASMRFTSAVVTADLWDVGRLAACDACRHERIGRLHQLNITGQLQPRVHCDVCKVA